MAKPLEGIKVLDLTRVLAGPYCTMMLSDLGAEVIKVERPSIGDDSRIFGPFKDGKSLYFISINRGKKSISINLKSEKGKEIIYNLVKEVDILVENFRPGTMEKLELSYDKLSKINPRLIYASSSGFGQTGPESKKPAYDILVQAMGGMMSITGWPETPPTRVGMSTGDITASLFTAIGINAALYQREKTGKGQRIDVSMLDCQVAILENALIRYQNDSIPPKPLGNRHPTITPFQAFKAKDDYIIIAAGNDKIWQNLCKLINREDLSENEKFKTNQNRTKNLDELISILNEIIEKKDANEWIKLLESVGVPSCRINDIEKVMKNEQLKARNMFIDVEDKDIGKIKIAGNPIKMTNLPEKSKHDQAPEIGENNNEILTAILNMTEEEIQKLKDEGVI